MTSPSSRRSWRAGSRAASNAAVLALLECPNGFDVLKTQSFHATRQFLVPSKVDKAAREIIEFNGKPPQSPIPRPSASSPTSWPTSSWPIHSGLMVGGEPFVRSPQQIVGQSVRFYCGVDEGMKLAVLDSTDIVEDTTAAAEEGNSTAIRGQKAC